MVKDFETSKPILSDVFSQIRFLCLHFCKLSTIVDQMPKCLYYGKEIFTPPQTLSAPSDKTYFFCADFIKLKKNIYNRSFLYPYL